ncbi:MAG: FG-GAP repeat protein [Candidatus Poribacteria bacterium]|nr:FG-GAP repeat protein [Candidatus Poribacteria bacterium]
MEKRFTLVVSAILIIIGQLTLSHAVEVKLIASDEAAGDDFGNSVSIDGDTVMVVRFSPDDDGVGK